MMYFSFVVVDAAAANAQVMQSHSQSLAAILRDLSGGQDLFKRALRRVQPWYGDSGQWLMAAGPEDAPQLTRPFTD